MKVLSTKLCICLASLQAGVRSFQEAACCLAPLLHEITDAVLCTLLATMSYLSLQMADIGWQPGQG